MSITSDAQENLIMAPSTNKVIHSTKPENIWTDGSYKVDKYTIKISFKAKSIGAVNSLVYLAVKCADEQHRDITSYEGDLVLSNITRVCEATKDTIILSVYNESVLNTFKENQNKVNSVIAFYFNEDFERMPDYILYKPASGVYCGSPYNKIYRACNTPERLYTINHQIITLSPEIVLPDHILEHLNSGKCNIRLHSDGGSYTYPIGSVTVKSEWTKYVAKISPQTNFRYFIDKPITGNPTHLRKETKYIKLGFLANYNQHYQNTELLIKDFKMKLLI